MSAGTVEKVQVVLDMISQRFARGTEVARKRLNDFTYGIRSMNRVMTYDMETMKKTMPYIDQWGSKSARVAGRLRNLTHGMRGFRMEMLGVMFFGMMLQQMFLGLLQPVMEAYGIFELFQAMLLIVFLPVMELLFPILMQIMEWFMNLPEPVKLVIGILAVVGAVVGTLLMLFGSFALGIGSLILVWALVIPLIAPFIPLILAVIAIVVAAIAIFLALQWAVENNFGGIRDFLDYVWARIVGIFQAAFSIIEGIFGVFIALFTGDTKKLGESVRQIMNGIVSLMKHIVGTIRDVALGLWNWLSSTFTNLVSSLYNWGVNIVKGLANGISSVSSWIKDAILGLFPKWARDMIWSTGSFLVDLLTGGGGSDTGGGGGLNDFIWRPGQGAQTFSPNDTLVGFKGNAPIGLSGGDGVTVNITNNFNGFTNDELRRELDDRDTRTVDQIRRLVRE